MHFERTTDLELVKFILTAEEIWPRIGDDFAPSRDAFWPNDDPRIQYILAEESWRVAGLFMFLPQSPVCWEGHVAMLRWSWGKVAHEAGREILPWVWEHSTCRRVICQIPDTNRAAVLWTMRAMGLKPYGKNLKSFLKGGQLRDQICMGISRPEES